MAKLIYATNMSLDGCTEDERGAFDWAPPDDDVFAFITKLMAGRAVRPSRSPGWWRWWCRPWRAAPSAGWCGGALAG